MLENKSEKWVRSERRAVARGSEEPKKKHFKELKG